MILIDALNVGAGANVLLSQLVGKLRGRQPIHVLRSSAENLEFESGWGRTSPLSRRRRRILRKAIDRHRPNTLLCFGNIPPDESYAGVRVVTYFHNAHLIRSLDRYRYKMIDHMRYYLLSRAVKSRCKFTNHWCVQTGFVSEAFAKFFKESSQRIELFPFFDLEQARDFRNHVKVKRNQFIYSSNGRPHKNHETLFDAWRLLTLPGRGNPRLLVTLNQKYPRAFDQLKRAQKDGANIVNLGEQTHSEILRYTAESEYAIFPSLLETVGLGIIEAAILGKGVLVSDLPFVNDIVVPQSTFDPLDAHDIASTVEKSLGSGSVKSKLIIKNRLDEFAEFLAAK